MEERREPSTKLSPRPTEPCYVCPLVQAHMDKQTGIDIPYRLDSDGIVPM